MNQEAIAIARRELVIPDDITDDEIAIGLEGSYIAARIDFLLEWRDFVRELKALFKMF